MENKLNKAISARIVELMERRNLTAYAVLKEVQIPKASFYKCIENQSEWKIDHLIQISKLFDASLNWLISGEKTSNIVKEKGVEYIAIDDAIKENNLLFEYPILADVPAGRSEINHHDWPEYIKIDIDPREHFALRIDEEYGISMAPYIEPGDILFCNFTRKFNSGDIVVARYDGTKGAVKRIFIDEQITLISFNPLESPIIINKRQLQQVFKVVLIWKKK